MAITARTPVAHAFLRSILVCLVALAAGCGLALTNEARLERAQEAYAEADYRAAIIDLRNILQQEPENRAARVLLGRAAVRTGDPATAEKELRRALDLGEPLASIAVDLGQAMLQLRQYNELLDEIRPALAADEATRLDILKLRADATMGLRLPGSARDIYLEVLEADPSDLAAKLGVVSTHVAQQNYEEARRTLEEALAIDPNYAPAWLASGSLHLTARDVDSAIADFVKAHELAVTQDNTSNRISALIGLVEARLADQDLAAAKQAVTDLRSLAPDNLTAKYLTARVAYLEEDYETAQTELADILSVAPEYRPAQFLMGAVHLQRGNLGQAEMHLSAVVAAAPDSVDARRLLAETRLRQNRAEDAAAILQPVLDADDTDVAALGLAVRASLAAGQYDNAIGYLRKSVRDNPDDMNLKLDLVTAYLVAGRNDDAEALIDTLPEEAGEAGYRRDLLRVMAPVRRGDKESALAEAQTFAERWPEDARARNLLGGIALSMGRIEQARENFLAARDIAPDNVTSYVNLARIAIREGDFAAAREQYLAALERVPDSADVMVALAQVEARTEDRVAAVEWLEKARAADSGAFVPRFLLARHYLTERKYDEARQLAEEAAAIQPGNAEAHNLLGLAHRGLGDNADAAAGFARATDLDPEVETYQVNLARARMEMGDLAEAEEAIRAAGGTDPDNIRASVMLAATLARQGDMAEAMKIAKDLQARHPDDGIPYALEGELLAEQGDYAAAAKVYSRALALRGDDRRLVLRAFRVRSSGDLPEPEQPLLSYLQKNPDDTGVRLVAAQSYQTAGESGAAISAYEQVLATEPENFVALNNLAWEYFQQGHARAEEIARRAYTLSPQNGAVADTLGWIQVNTGNLEEGIPMLRSALELSNGRAQVKYHLAAALAKAGEAAAARALLEEVLSSGEDFESREAAEQLLATL